MGPAAERLAENLKRMRFTQRLTTAQLAESVSGLGRPMYANTITKIEKLQRRVDVDDLVALAAALGVTPAQLLEEPTGCDTCHGTPPSGFACNDCGAGAPTP
jgi:transcriptional regulator with XRE-family HTH domain